jgi:hypothetical protein
MVLKVILPSGCEVEFYYSQKDGWFLQGFIKQLITYTSLAFGKFKLKKGKKANIYQEVGTSWQSSSGDSKVF